MQRRQQQHWVLHWLGMTLHTLDSSKWLRVLHPSPTSNKICSKYDIRRQLILTLRLQLICLTVLYVWLIMELIQWLTSDYVFISIRFMFNIHSIDFSWNVIDLYCILSYIKPYKRSSSSCLHLSSIANQRIPFGNEWSIAFVLVICACTH